MRHRYKAESIGQILTGIAFVCVLFCLAANASAEAFPDFYEAENGKVTFQCRLWIPKDLTDLSIQKAKVESVYFSEHEKALELLAGERMIESEDIYPAEDGVSSEMRYYTFSDGAVLLTGNSTNFSTLNNEHYHQAFQNIDQYSLKNMGDSISWGTIEGAEKEVRELMAEVGYPADMKLTVFPMPFETAREWEVHLDHNGGNLAEAYKTDWTEADDAYVVYGYQMFAGLPVYHELMFLGGAMKYMTASNAPVQAILTQTGMEQFTAQYLYRITGSDECVSLCPFDSVAETISEKINTYLDEISYEVTDAVLVWMVRSNQEQTYDCFPGWYAEVTSQNGTEAVLVDAVSAEEVFIR